MSVNIYDIDNIHEDYVFSVKTFEREARNCSLIRVEAGAHYLGTGNAGALTFFSLSIGDAQVDRVEINGEEIKKNVNKISIWLIGHDEYRAMIESLEFAANILREAEKFAETEK